MISFLNANATINIYLVKIALLLFIVLTVNAYLTWFERKVVAHMQSRWGPHRVGPHGLLQPLADGAKFLLKEDPTPAGVDKFTYFLAPLMALALALTSIAIIPFGPDPLPWPILGQTVFLGIANLNIGILALFAITALSVYGVALAGWSSNSKYPLLGGLRSSAQMVSYELALTMSVVGVLLLAGSFNLRDIINAQAHHPERGILGWNIWPQILGFICFFVAAVAETNRVPFDLPEAENELVAGFHTEYSSMTFAAFFMAEYANMITVSCIATLLFLGGWHPLWPVEYGSSFLAPLILAGSGLVCFSHAVRPARPFDRITLPVFGVLFLGLAGLFLVPAGQQILMPLFWFGAKTGTILFVFIWVRATLPRFRYDQLMNFAWTFMFPVALINLFVTALVVALR